MTGSNDLFDFGKVFMVAGVSVLVGVFVGSRTGGEYIFEIGDNLLSALYDVLIFGVVIYFLFICSQIIEKRGKNES